ncbi:CPBP family glutamic-type intramembrane protease [Nostoc sp.]|uniref:CPBP family glutamic-type intramembrane protease n=1 Tax=Nostoc sp. TaxID=1180 RepID=UPI002FF783BC
MRCFFLPAIVGELLFRVFLLPNPSEITNWFQGALWAIVNLLLFVLYHPLNAKTFYKAGIATFYNHVFLFLARFLGVICTVAYNLTGSLFAIVLIH